MLLLMDGGSGDGLWVKGSNFDSMGWEWAWMIPDLSAFKFLGNEYLTWASHRLRSTPLHMATMLLYYYKWCITCVRRSVNSQECSTAVCSGFHFKLCYVSAAILLWGAHEAADKGPHNMECTLFAHAYLYQKACISVHEKSSPSPTLHNANHQLPLPPTLSAWALLWRQVLNVGPVKLLLLASTLLTKIFLPFTNFTCFFWLQVLKRKPKEEKSSFHSSSLAFFLLYTLHASLVKGFCESIHVPLRTSV